MSFSVSKIFRITTNLKDKNGNKVEFQVVARNAREAIYGASDVKYNGESVEEHIQVVSCNSNLPVIATYYTDNVQDLNPDYKSDNDKSDDDNLDDIDNL